MYFLWFVQAYCESCGLLGLLLARGLWFNTVSTTGRQGWKICSGLGNNVDSYQKNQKSRKSQKILFGGTFDPIHNGHLIIARAVAEELGADRVTLIPAARSPHKGPASASAHDRLNMLRAAIEGDSLFELSDIELHRDGPSYTRDTLLQIRRQTGENVQLCWVIGADMLLDLPNWHEAGEVLELARIVIATRPPWDRKLGELLESLDGRLDDSQVQRLRQSVIHVPLIDICSTVIRERVAAGLEICYLTPDPVRKYILAKRLYR